MFRRLRVKRSLLAGLEEEGEPLLARRGERLDSEEWNTVLDTQQPVLLDIRNTVEWEVSS